jgi:endoglucanase
MKQRYTTILRSLLSAPTAPFHEEAVVEQVRCWSEKRGVDFTRDKAGNVFVHYRKGRRCSGQRWVFAAHMDHPGFVVRNCRGRVVRADFFGGVGREYFPGSRVRLFAPSGEVLATVRSVRKVKDSPALSCRLELDGPADVPPGTVGMWNLPAMRIRGKRLSSRACDDVVGVAAVICAMDEIISRKIDADVTGFLTRGEEAAFIGAMAACEAGSITRDAMIIAIETSKAQPTAPLGGGVVVRVGDKTRTFDPSLTAHVTSVATSLSKRDRYFRFIRQLMPGGTCESTAYCIFGYTATGLCLPLGNYHNQGPEGRIAAEQIHLDDFASLVKLLIALTAEKRKPRDTDDDLKKRLRHLLKTRGKYL